MQLSSQLENDEGPSLEASLNDGYSHLIEVETTAPPALMYVIEQPDPLDALRSHPSADLPITLMSRPGADLASFLQLLQDQVGMMLVARDLEDISTGTVWFKKTPFIKVLQYLSLRYDITFEFHPDAGILEFKRDIARQLIIPPILDADTDTLLDEGNGGGEDLYELISSAASDFGLTINAFSKTTGLLRIEGRPSKMKAMMSIIEQEARERMQFVTIHFMLLELTVEKEYERSFSLDGIPGLSSISEDLFGTFSFTSPSGVGDVVTSVTSLGSDSLTTASSGSALEVGTNSLSTLLTLFEQWGTTEVLTAPAVMTANGVPVQFEITDATGYWEPGDITIEEDDDDDTTTTTEDKPTFVDDEVGLYLNIQPKILRDSVTHETFVELDIHLESTEISSYSTIEWDRSSETDAVTLSRPLKASKELTSRAILRENELLLLAKLDKRDNTHSEQGTPGLLGKTDWVSTAATGEGYDNSDSKTYIIINAVLPDSLKESK
jgi:hypothetical protein